MSQIDIKSALETTLKTITPLIDTVYEGMDYTPKAGVPYQRVNLIMNPPTDPCVFSDFYRESGIFQVMLCYPKAGGLNPAQVQAEKIRKLFRDNKTPTKNSVRVLINRTPDIRTLPSEVDRIIVVVRVFFTADIFT